MQLAAADGVVPVHHGLRVVVVDEDVSRGAVLQVVQLQRVRERDLLRAECDVDVRDLDDGLRVLLVLDVVLDGVLQLGQDELPGQELIVLPSLLHEVALHEAGGVALPLWVDEFLSGVLGEYPLFHQNLWSVLGVTKVITINYLSIQLPCQLSCRTEEPIARISAWSSGFQPVDKLHD